MNSNWTKMELISLEKYKEEIMHTNLTVLAKKILEDGKIKRSFSSIRRKLYLLKNPSVKDSYIKDAATILEKRILNVMQKEKLIAPTLAKRFGVSSTKIHKIAKKYNIKLPKLYCLSDSL